ncbi:metallophosphoesterase [Mesorhizobium sp. KR1-2]|uniref:metallophosphoesterase n=1 Tax=Mesorhizobium sp. KR1-2 TaxID=3156609 RepID=UPI0032B4FE41
MRIWILSDLHLEHADLTEPLEPPQADVCVISGDLCRGIDNGIRWLTRHIAPAMPCIYVAGNHEFYKGSIQEGIAAGRAAAQAAPGVHFLENEAVIINGVRFLGATLWTDFRIQGAPEAAMDHARRRMNDYRQISWQRNPWKRFLPLHAYRIHQESRAFLDAELSSSPSPTVVVTHHLPHPRSLPGLFKGDLTNAAFASDLSSILKTGTPALWVHGHVHDSCDYVVHNTPSSPTREDTATRTGRLTES